MQDHLGDLNDANVACQLLQDFLDRQPAQEYSEEQQHLHQAVQAYLLYNQSERERLYSSFPEEWANFNRPEVRKRLAEAISIL
jgi:CHAD domain-containing protein